MKLNKKYTCAIIGLGKIGLKYDLNRKNFIQTHSKALNNNKYFSLTCGVDVSLKSLNLFKNTYKKKTFKTLEGLKKSKLKIDMFVIATPTDLHYRNFLFIVKNFKPNIIVCEKPVSFKSLEIKKISKICINKKIKFVVNFIRRSDDVFIKLKKLFEKNNNKVLGKVYYDKGFYHSCSHYLNLMNFWFGKYKSHKIIKIHKRNKDDSKIDVLINFEKADIQFINTNAKTKREFILKFNSIKIVKYKNKGITINNKRLPFTMKQYQKKFYSELLKYINNKKEYNLPTIKDVLYNDKIITKILKKY
jgi:predicted dehydrogenase